MPNVEVGYFSGKPKRLKLLLRCRIGDKNFWYDPATNSYTLCLDEETLLLLYEGYVAINTYNEWKLSKYYN